MEGHVQGDAVRVGGDARQRYHDSRGYGRPLGGNEIALSRVEAAHLLFRGDIEAVDGAGFEAFFVSAVGQSDRFALRFLVYADLRGRGFYLSPAREGWPGGAADPRSDFVVYPRGQGPGDGEVAHQLRVAGERRPLPAADLGGLVLAVVDEESEITYFEAEEVTFDGATDFVPSESLTGALLEDRVICWNTPDGVYGRGFYGQPLSGRDAATNGGLQLSLVEAASLAAHDLLSLDDDADTESGVPGDAYEAIVNRGREVEGGRFDRRLHVYSTLRERGVVPKTGYKFGADFRTYDEVESVEDLPHSENLVRVVPADHQFAPRDLSLDVRLAGGVRKRMVFALTDTNEEVRWLSIARLTP